jgi:hypothetical protein
MIYCNGKVRYDKRGAVTAKNHRWEVAHIALRIYECPECRGWHLTSTRVWVDRRKYNGKYKKHRR